MNLPELRRLVMHKMQALTELGNAMLQDLLDLYAERIERAGLFRECGAACSDEFDTLIELPERYNDLIVAPTHCQSLLSNRQVWFGTDLYPPPSFPPRRWRNHFVNDDIKNISRLYFLDIAFENKYEETCWNKDFIRKIIEDIKKTNDARPITNCCGYDADGSIVQGTYEFFNGILAWGEYENQIKGKHWLVIGTEIPWLEILLIAAGARNVTTVEYRSEKWMDDIHPQLNFVNPTEFSNYPNQFDGVIQFSSIEHSGLGRYGDAINPFADRQIVQAAWCMLKPGGWMLTCTGDAVSNPDVKESKVIFNVGKVYGTTGFAKLFKNFRLQFEHYVYQQPRKIDIEVTQIPNFPHLNKTERTKPKIFYLAYQREDNIPGNGYSDVL